MAHKILRGQRRPNGISLSTKIKQESAAKKQRRLTKEITKGRVEKKGNWLQMMQERRRQEALALAAKNADPMDVEKPKVEEVTVATKEPAAKPAPQAQAEELAPGGKKLSKKEAILQARLAERNRGIYGAEDSILLVGEGNFSFARAMCEVLGTEGDIIATAYDSEHMVNKKYTDAAGHREHIEKELQGTTLVNVDATKLHKMKDFRAGFDKIVWNFPHMGGGEANTDKSIKEHRQLLKKFFQSAVQCLDPDSASPEIHVTLKSGEPYKSWKVVQLATEACPLLKFENVEQFVPAAWPGYSHRRTAGFDERFSKFDNEELTQGARVYVFRFQKEQMEALDESD